MTTTDRAIEVLCFGVLALCAVAIALGVINGWNPTC